MKFKWRSLHTGWESGELHLSIGVGSSLKVESSHSTKPIFDMHRDRGSINGFAIYAQYCKFERTASHAAVDDGDFFIGCWRLSPKKQRGCDDDGAQNTKHSVHIHTIIRAESESPHHGTLLSDARSGRPHQVRIHSARKMSVGVAS